MSALLGEYSFITISAGFTLIAGVILLSNKPRWNDYLAFGAIVVGLIVAWASLHPRQTLLMDDAREVKEMIGAGTPVLLEFQSPYCIRCVSIKPLVDDLELELGDQIHIIRLNVQEQVGMELSPVYGFEFTPTFIYFDSAGNEIWRTIGDFNPQQVRDTIANE
ncbi:MAG: thioredoxin family protein [Anaerolineae bacterium]|jgi:thioredoxin 1|nr:thioredoxin family protein [Anaerolineae bacterium]